MENKDIVAEEYFQMSRILLALAQCDEFLTREEMKIIFDNLSKKGDTTKEQDSILEDDINNPKDVVELLKGIESDHAKATLVFQICLLPFSDKYVDKREKDTVYRILDNMEFDEKIKSKAREFIAVAFDLSGLLAAYI